ncbi:hypothetical protein [Nonomuraea zeae]|uniref:Uncharacterized protein n=1 Tax=Nonomuraea zeae TaxID=1642303 RepID=A0A5S4FZ62_9ACTN|nr:hypothetical protein [Nonomuraea zeae]TMR25989.1 hypothetical protein ETD85_43950 [Nonomuraea zeae]
MTNEETPGIVGSWLHSFEEDTGTTTVYRRDDFPFPPARRGRAGMDFRPDGTFVSWTPGPDDRPRAAVGRWDQEGAGRIRITFPAEQGRSSDLTVLSQEHDQLIVAK